MNALPDKASSVTLWVLVPWVLLCLAWLNPLHIPPWSGFHQEVLAFAGLLLLVMQWAWRQNQTVRLPQLAVYLALFAVVPWLQWGFGVLPYAGDAVVACVYILAAACAVAAGGGKFGQGSPPAIVGLGYTIIVAALISAAIGLLQWLSLHGVLGSLTIESPTPIRAVSNLAQPNQFATLLLMGAVALVHAHVRSRIGLLGLVMGVAFLSFAMVLTQSRTGLLTGSVLAIYGCVKLRQLGCLRRGGAWIGTWLVSYWALYAAYPWLANAFFLGNGLQKSLSVDGDRRLIWRQVLDGIGQSPWTGYGWNQTAVAQRLGSVAHPGDLQATFAHNAPLDMMAWWGVPLGLLVVAATGWWLLNRAWKVRGPDQIFALAMLLPVAVHSLLEYPFAYAYFALPVALLMGVVDRPGENARCGRLIATKVVWSVWATALVLGTGTAWEYVEVEEGFRAVRFENQGLTSAVSDLQRYEPHLMTQMGALLQFALVQPKPGMAPDDLAALKQVAYRFPYATLAAKYATALALNGAPQAARLELDIIRGLYGEAVYIEVQNRLVEHLRKLGLPPLARSTF